MATSLHRELLMQSRRLLTLERKHHRQASLRRAVSAAYYAVFHLLISEAVKSLLPGTARSQLRSIVARAFNHGPMLATAVQAKGGKIPAYASLLTGPLPPELIAVGKAFENLQQARHEADYNTGKAFTLSEATDLVELAEQTFADWKSLRGGPEAELFLLALLGLAARK